MKVLQYLNKKKDLNTPKIAENNIDSILFKVKKLYLLNYN